MFNYIKNAFTVTKNNFVLVSQFVLVFLSIEIIGVVILLKAPMNYMVTLIAGIALFMLSVALFSGWLNMIKNAVENHKKDTSDKADIYLLTSHFFPGVSEYFLPNLLLSFVYFILFVVIAIIIFNVLIHVKPALSMNMADIAEIRNTLMNLKQFTPEILTAKMKVFLFWTGLVNAFHWIYMYIMMFSYASEYSKKTFKVFSVIWDTIKFVFKNFAKVLIIFALLSLVYLALSLLSLKLSQNIILNIIGLFLMGFYMTFYVTLVFLFYGEKA